MGCPTAARPGPSPRKVKGETMKKHKASQYFLIKSLITGSIDADQNETQRERTESGKGKKYLATFLALFSTGWITETP